MSLVTSDIDLMILRQLFKQANSDKHRTELLHKLHQSFRGSTQQDFLRQARELYFAVEFQRRGVANLEGLLLQLLQRRQIQFDCYRQFQREHQQGNQTITFVNLNRRARTIVKFLALYHGYCYVYSNTQYREVARKDSRNKEHYIEFHGSRPNQAFSYEELRRHRVHNLKYYDVTDEGLYRWRSDNTPRRTPPTTERCDMLCYR